MQKPFCVPTSDLVSILTVLKEWFKLKKKNCLSYKEDCTATFFLQQWLPFVTVLCKIIIIFIINEIFVCFDKAISWKNFAPDIISVYFCLKPLQNKWNLLPYSFTLLITIRKLFKICNSTDAYCEYHRLNK